MAEITLPELKENVDGSVDLYLGPKALASQESNWIPTSADGQFEVLFRLYGPDKMFFGKKWILPDIEQVGYPIKKDKDDGYTSKSNYINQGYRR